MKRLIVWFCLCFICQSVYCQEYTAINLNWKEGVYQYNGLISFSLPHFQEENFVFDYDLKSIEFRKIVGTKNIALLSSLKVVNMQYEDVSKEKLGILNVKNISNSTNFKLLNIIGRNENSVVLSFSPIVFFNGNYKKIRSFEYSFDYDLSQIERQSAFRRAGLQNSVLKSGVFKKFYVQKSGVYKLSKTFLNQLGVNVNVDPRTIKIYGNGGRMLPLLNSVSYPDDLAENAIQFIGEEDGVFNDTDYILFYAEGLDNWSNDNQTHNNLYDDKSYYYVTTGSGNGKRIVNFNQPINNPDFIYDKYNEYQYHEIDKVNIGAIGRKWFGEDFNIQNTQNFIFSIPNLDTSIPVEIGVRAAAAGSIPTNLKVQINGSDFGTMFFNGISDLSSIKGVESNLNSSYSSNLNQLNFNLTFNNNGNPSSKCYLDFITINAKAYLKGLNKQYRFRVVESASNIGIGEYRFTEASNISQIWDITDIYNVLTIRKAEESNFAFKSSVGSLKEFIVVDKNDYLTPLIDAKATVLNQDLKGTIFFNAASVFQDIDYLIVTPVFLVSQAERLASFHRNHSGLNVKVVTLDKIYEEFSSGKQDIGAIRNFIKYVYENATSSDKRIKYVCLFGDASFDFKNRIRNNTNIVPVFQSIDSYTLFSSFVSDDFFGLMNANEGNMLGAQGLDIAVGRILVSSIENAEQMVTKIIDYHDEKAKGKWQNNLVFLSDDVDKVSDATLQSNLDNMSNMITNNKPFFNSRKIFTDAYFQETTSGGQKYPKAKEEFLNSFTQGALVMDYLGHGGEDGLAAERLFDIADTRNLSHRYKYPLLITVTCEFTRYDNPLRETGGEVAYQNAFGGPIALITTTRQIGQITGENFNTNLAPILFPFNSSSYFSVAEVVRLTKNQSMSAGNNVVSFIGDPALKLAIPKPEIKLVKINDIPLASFTGSLEALAKVKFSGEVLDELGSLKTDYNGEVFVNIFDKEISKTTLGNDNIVIGGVVYKMSFTTLGETIFRGNASVKNGIFDLSFIVPKDIRIPVGNGKISFYAKKSNSSESNAGFDNDIKIGGVNINAPIDNIAPAVQVYMNDKTFVSGGTTNQSPILVINAQDSSGINTAGGIGHDIIAYLDGDETNPIVLNDYYETEKDDFTIGKLQYQLRNLLPGIHTVTVKVSDVYNNITIKELQFIVIDDVDLKLTNVLNYPNPFVNYTEFWFTHNKPFETLEVQVQVLTVTGKIVWTKNQTVFSDGFTSRDIVWDGKDDFGDKIGKGIYVYRLTVKSTITNKKIEKFEKLVIL